MQTVGQILNTINIILFSLIFDYINTLKWNRYNHNTSTEYMGQIEGLAHRAQLHTNI